MLRAAIPQREGNGSVKNKGTDRKEIREVDAESPASVSRNNITGNYFIIVTSKVKKLMIKATTDIRIVQFDNTLTLFASVSEAAI